jgi:hypothetical protein
MRMPEGLKNADLTFCRMMKAKPRDQIYRNVFTYIDDILVATKKKSTQIDDLAETFVNMSRAQLKLNPEKCVFGVQRGKVPRCMVSVKGIEANLDKLNAIVHMRHPQSKNEA